MKFDFQIERGNLMISGATKSDNGEYKCVAENMAGTRETIGVILSVHGKLNNTSCFVSE